MLFLGSPPRSFSAKDRSGLELAVYREFWAALYSRWLKGAVVEIFGVRAGEAEALAVAVDEAVEVDAFSAEVAGDALALEAGELAGREGDADPGFAEEIGVGEFAVGGHLLGVAFEGGVELAGSVFGGLEGDEAEGFKFMADGSVVVAVEGMVEVDEGGGHLAEVAKFQGALADTRAGDGGYCVCSTAVDFDKDDQALAVGVEGAVGESAGAWVVDAEAREGEHGHAYAEDLAGAEVAVGDFSVVQESVEGGGHERLCYASCVRGAYPRGEVWLEPLGGVAGRYSGQCPFLTYVACCWRRTVPVGS